MIIPNPPSRGSKVDTDRWLEQTQQILNGKIEFEDNIGGEFVDATFVSGVPLAIPHNLGTIPDGFLVMYKMGSGDIFRPIGSLWSSSVITLQSTSSITAHIFIVGRPKTR